MRETRKYPRILQSPVNKTVFKQALANHEFLAYFMAYEMHEMHAIVKYSKIDLKYFQMEGREGGGGI